MIITVTSHKGGVGKTVTAIHIAGHLAEMHGPGSTALVDLDPNGSALTWAGDGHLPFRVLDDDDRVESEEFVVYDSQGRLRDEDLEVVAEGSDLMVLATTARQSSVDALLLLQEDIEELDLGTKYKVLLTMVPWWNPRRSKSLQQELRELRIPVFDSSIPFREAVEDAWDAGVLVKDVRRRNAREVWEAYGKVSVEVLRGL